ncbi:MAG: FMN-binding glutamate synthase family protein [Nocardiaceae bacterium]|nr:FMN-binding glutamate synthase family protein [Nocardiaceae bacterium]
MPQKRIALGAASAAAAGVVMYDLLQRRHAVLRNFPIVGHLRYLLEETGPELRQYVTTGNDEERPFSRNQRRWIYASSKLQNNHFGFGSDRDIEHTASYPIIKHRTFSHMPAGATYAGEQDPVPCAKVLGGPRNRRKSFRPKSIVNVSGMSFGALSGNALEAINRGAAATGAMHNTGEGGLSRHHRHGADLVFQLGTGYFGCRDERGRFDLGLLKELVDSAPVRALEIKLSQGAKPGLGGFLPAAKVTAEIAQARRVAPGVDCASPARHTEFDDVDSMLDWVEMLADETGLPVGIKSAVGALDFWTELADLTASSGRGVDFVTIDGGEGGTGAAPLVFSESVGLPFRVGFPRVYRIFAEAGLDQTMTFIGSGKLGVPDNAVVAFALGCDMVNVGREMMMSVGCIQAQRCHTGRCPAGVATQNPWLAHGLDPDLKSERAANYLKTLRRDLLNVAQACGVAHPALIGTDDLDLIDNAESGRSLREACEYQPGWGLPSPADQVEIARIMSRL